ncbi:hypothetical protein [Cellulomonas terrae]|uniref:hypothetical protein n=1 Tax=Cellulomonas terrae TaxID=311234 RepID=UPI001649A32D|nr:hypothetical protein [Cellulomonas terrae]
MNDAGRLAAFGLALAAALGAGLGAGAAVGPIDMAPSPSTVNQSGDMPSDHD